MAHFPFNPRLRNRMQTQVRGLYTTRQHTARYSIAGALAVAADTNGVLAAVTDNGAEQVITTGLTSPAVPRNITATTSGTNTDVKAIQVTVEGTDYAGNVITETLPAFTVNVNGTVAGSKAFKTVTKVTIPPHDGTGCATEIGWGDKLGLPDKLPHDTVSGAYLNNVFEATPPTVATSASVLASNTVDLNSALNGSNVDIYYLVSG